MGVLNYRIKGVLFFTACLIITSCGTKNRQSWFYEGNFEPSSTMGLTSGSGSTPSTMPVNCYGAYVPCGRSLQTMVDTSFPGCGYAIRRLCDASGKALSPDLFCVAGAQPYSYADVLAICQSK